LRSVWVKSAVIVSTARKCAVTWAIGEGACAIEAVARGRRTKAKVAARGMDKLRIGIGGGLGRGD
jgi:hypothetical protein